MLHLALCPIIVLPNIRGSQFLTPCKARKARYQRKSRIATVWNLTLHSDNGSLRFAESDLQSNYEVSKRVGSSAF